MRLGDSNGFERQQNGSAIQMVFGVLGYRLLTRTHTHTVFLRVEVTLKFESLPIFSLL